MKDKLILLLSTFLLIQLTEAKRERKQEEKIASKEEINKFLFNDTSATYLDDFKKANLNVLKGPDDEAEFAPARNVKFVFRSQSDQIGKTYTFEERNSIDAEVIDASKPLRVIIHGWQNKIDSPMIGNVSEAYLQTKDVTLMIVDWSELAKENYLVARRLIDNVANVTALFLKFLVDSNLVNLENVHLIGHSLGGHTVGLVGKAVQKLGLKKIPLVFALDPAGPLFSPDEKDERVDKDDAELVVVLHTSSLLGYTGPLGHVDFYANFGSYQPGCQIDLLRQCAHSRAYMYFADAIRVKDDMEFWAVKCNSNFDDIEAETCDPTDIQARFGESIHKDLRSFDGLFVFQTNSEKPWAKDRTHLENLRAWNSLSVKYGPSNIFFFFIFALFKILL